MERRLVSDYCALVQDLASTLSSTNAEVATQLAALPAEVKGYGHVKRASVEKAERRRDQLLAKLDRKPARLDNAA